MVSRQVQIQLTGTNASAVAAIEGVSTAATQAGAVVESKLGGATQRVGTEITKLSSLAGGFGVPFTGALSTVGNALAQTETKTRSFGQSVSTLGGTELVAAGVGLLAVGASSLKVADNFDVAHQRLVTAVKDVGQNMNTEGDAIKGADDKLTNLGFKSGDTESALARLTLATKDTGKATELMGLAADIARGRNIPLATATNILATAETGRVGALARLNINMKDSQGHTVDLQTALARLTTMYSGQAAAYLDTYAGKTAVLGAKAEDVQVQLGNLEKQGLERVADGAIIGIQAFQNFNASLDGIPGKVALVAAAIPAATFALSKLYEAGSFTITTIGNVGSAVSGAKDAFEAAVSTAGSLGSAVGGTAAAMNSAEAAARALKVANAETTISEEALMTATGHQIDAEVAWEAVATSSTATAAEVVAANTAIATSATEAATATTAMAVSEAAAATAGEALFAGVGAVTALGVALVALPVLATGAAIAYAWKEGESFDSTIKRLATDLDATGKKGSDAKASLTSLFGGGTTSALETYRTALTDGASKATLAADKANVLATALKEDGFSAEGASTGGHQYASAVSEVRNEVDQATSAVQKKYETDGKAAALSATLSAAEKKYADDLSASGVSARQLAVDKAAVTAASTQEAGVQNTVNAAVDAGTNSTKANSAATTTQTDAAKQLTTAQNALKGALNSGNEQQIATYRTDLARATLNAAQIDQQFAAATAQAGAQAALASGGVISLADAMILLGQSAGAAAVSSLDAWNQAASVQFDQAQATTQGLEAVNTALHGNQTAAGGAAGATKNATQAWFDQEAKVRATRDALIAVSDANLALTRSERDQVQSLKDVATAQKNYNDIIHGVSASSATGATAHDNLTSARDAQTTATLDLRDAEATLAKDRSSGAAPEQIQRDEIAINEARIRLHQTTSALTDAERIYQGTIHGFPATSKEAQDATTALQTAQDKFIDSTNNVRNAQNKAHDSVIDFTKALDTMNGVIGNVNTGAASGQVKSFQANVSQAAGAAKTMADNIGKEIAQSTGSVAAGMMAEITALKSVVDANPILAGAFDTLLANMQRALALTLNNLPKTGLNATGSAGITGGSYGLPAGTPQPPPPATVKPGTRARGGSVAAGQMYVVGEEGPEMFVPRETGSIIPNGTGRAVAGNTQPIYVVVHVDPITGKQTVDVLQRYNDINGPLPVKVA